MKLVFLEQPWWSGTAIVSDLVREELGDHLTSGEIEAMRELPTERRRIEWAAARVAVKSLLEREGFPRLGSTVERSGGRPRAIVGGTEWPGFVSISHSRSVAAGVISPAAVGIDLQDVRQIDERAAKFFLNPQESDLLRFLAIEARLIHLWAAKEAAWKASAAEGALLKSVVLELADEDADGLALFYTTGGRRGRVETGRRDEHFVMALAREGHE